MKILRDFDKNILGMLFKRTPSEDLAGVLSSDMDVKSVLCLMVRTSSIIEFIKGKSY